MVRSDYVKPDEIPTEMAHCEVRMYHGVAKMAQTGCETDRFTCCHTCFVLLRDLSLQQPIRGAIWNAILHLGLSPQFRTP